MLFYFFNLINQYIKPNLIMNFIKINIIYNIIKFNLIFILNQSQYTVFIKNGRA